MAEALRFNSDKPMMAYFMRSFPRMAEAVARVKEMGAIKYNDGNWRLGNKPDDEYWNSLFRHLNYIFAGEDYDEDTGCLHIGHAVWNLCALLELNHPDLPARDDEIWAERAAHWAEQKRIREAGEVVEEMPEFIEPPVREYEFVRDDKGCLTEVREVTPGTLEDTIELTVSEEMPSRVLDLSAVVSRQMKEIAVLKEQIAELQRQKILDDPKWDDVPTYVAPRGGGVYVLRKPELKPEPKFNPYEHFDPEQVDELAWQCSDCGSGVGECLPGGSVVCGVCGGPSPSELDIDPATHPSYVGCVEPPVTAEPLDRVALGEALKREVEGGEYDGQGFYVVGERRMNPRPASPDEGPRYKKVGDISFVIKEDEACKSFKDLVSEYMRPYFKAKAMAKDRQCVMAVDQVMADMDQGVRRVGDVMEEMDNGGRR